VIGDWSVVSGQWSLVIGDWWLVKQRTTDNGQRTTVRAKYLENYFWQWPIIYLPNASPLLTT